MKAAYKVALLKDLVEYVKNGNVAGACMSSARLMAACKLAAVQDAAMRIFLDPKYISNAAFVGYLAKRLPMTCHLRYRKDVPAMRRLLCEIFAMLAKNAKPDGAITVKPCEVLSVNKSKCAGLLSGFCTKEVFSVIEKILRGVNDVHTCVDDMLEIKDYHLSVPVARVQESHCKDPVWLVWRIITEVYKCDAALAKYIDDLFELYKFRFRKRSRRDRADLLKYALNAISGRSLIYRDAHSDVCIEAAWKIQYIYNEIEESKVRAAAPPPDVIGTMLI